MPIKQDLTTNDKPVSDSTRNKELDLNNKILEMKLNYLTLLKHHVENCLEFDVDCQKAKVDCEVNKAIFEVKMKESKNYNELLDQVNREDENLREKIVQSQTKLDQLKKLNPALLAEYRALKEELECQEMLIQISECNVNKMRK